MLKSNDKDSIFRMLYLDKRELLSLYNAVNGTHYTNSEDLEINTLQNAIYMNIKNDVSFLFNFQVNLYEHQSTVNPNMPLRDLFYVSDLLQNYVKDFDLYGRGLVKIPAPRFIVFYNGREKQPERRVYKLSDAFSKKQDEPELELTVTVLNINAGNNGELLGNCKTLREYATQMDIEEAVERAITECIREGILAEFLKRNRAEAIKVSIYEYNEELHLENVRREGFEEGMSLGKTRAIQELLLEILNDLGVVSEELKAMIMCEMNIEVLNSWVKQVMKFDTVEAFENYISK